LVAPAQSVTGPAFVGAGVFAGVLVCFAVCAGTVVAKGVVAVLSAFVVVVAAGLVVEVATVVVLVVVCVVFVVVVAGAVTGTSVVGGAFLVVVVQISHWPHAAGQNLEATAATLQLGSPGDPGQLP